MQRPPVLSGLMPLVRALAAGAAAWGLVAAVAAAPVGTAPPVPGVNGDEENLEVGSPPAGVRDKALGERLPGRAAAPDVPTTSKTIDMLLEMQGRAPGLAPGERPRDTGMPAERPRPAQRAADDAAALGGAAPPAFPSPAAPMQRDGAAREDAAVNWTGPAGPVGVSPAGGGGWAQGPAGDDGDRGGAGASRGASSEDRWILIPRSAVRFVRENRETVIGGSVAVLLALWVASAFAARRRR